MRNRERQFLFQIFKMALATDIEFTYFIKISNNDGERYYLKSNINEQNNTILVHLTNLKHSWVGTRKYLVEVIVYLCIHIYMKYVS